MRIDKLLKRFIHNIFRETVAQPEELDESDYDYVYVYECDSASDEERESEPLENSQQNDASELACKWCDKKFQSQNQLYIHTNRNHMGGEYSEF